MSTPANKDPLKDKPQDNKSKDTKSQDNNPQNIKSQDTKSQENPIGKPLANSRASAVAVKDGDNQPKPVAAIEKNQPSRTPVELDNGSNPPVSGATPRSQYKRRKG